MRSMARSADATTRATRDGANASAFAVIVYAVLWVLSTQVGSFRAVSPFADDPWDAFASFAALFLPIVAGATWIRSLRHRGRILSPVTASRIRWGSGLASGDRPDRRGSRPPRDPDGRVRARSRGRRVRPRRARRRLDRPGRGRPRADDPRGLGRWGRGRHAGPPGAGCRRRPPRPRQRRRPEARRRRARRQGGVVGRALPRPVPAQPAPPPAPVRDRARPRGGARVRRLARDPRGPVGRADAGAGLRDARRGGRPRDLPRHGGPAAPAPPARAADDLSREPYADAPE